MPENLTGAWRAHFVAALGVAVVQLGMTVVTWLPGSPVLPRWLPFGLLPCTAVLFVMGACGGVRAWGLASWSCGPRVPFFAWRLIGRALRLLHWPLRYALVVAWGVAAVGLATAVGETGRFEERADGYYRLEQSGRALPSGPVAVSDAEYARAQRAEQRIVSALPAFLSLSAAVMGASRLVRWDAPPMRRRGSLMHG